MSGAEPGGGPGAGPGVGPGGEGAAARGAAVRQRVVNLLAADRPEQAIDLLRPHLAEEPDDASALRLMSEALLASGRAAASLDAANRAVALEPDDVRGHLRCSLALSETGQHDEAVRAAGEAVRLAPWHWGAHQILSMVAAELPDRRGVATAQRAAREAVRLAPDEPGAHFAVGYAAHRARDRRTARTAYQHTLALDPQHAVARNNLTAVTPTRRLAPAAQGYAAALSLDPQQATARGNLTVLTQRFATRLYWLGLLAFAVGAITGAAVRSADRGSFSLPGVVVALVIVVSAVGYTLAVGRAVPLGARRHAVGLLVQPSLPALRAGLAVVLFVAAVVLCLDTALAFEPVLQVVGLLTIGLVVAQASRRPG